MYAIRLSEEYTLEFVEALPASYTCTNCQQFLGEPYQNVECGDRFCGDCVRLITNGAKKCSGCGALMTNETTFVDAAVRREIDELKLCCPFKRYDCGETLLYGNLRDHIEACSKKPVEAEHASADSVPSAAMTALASRVDMVEKMLHDLHLKLDGVNNHVSSLVLWKSNNTMNSGGGDVGGGLQTGEMARRLKTLEEVAQRASAVHGSITFDVNEFETRMSRLTLSLQDLYTQVDRHEQTSYDGVLIWKIDNFRQKKNDRVCRSVFSPLFYSHRFGYKMCARACLNGDLTGRDEYLSLFLVLLKGEYDAILDFPFPLRVNFILLDQENRSRNLSYNGVPDAKSTSFHRPINARNVGTGFPKFVHHSVLETPTYLKDDCIYLRIAVGKE